MSRTVNDNVFGRSPGADADLISAGWTTGSSGAKEHRFDQLENSDNAELELTCGSNSWTWHQGYLYQDGSEWKSDYLDNSIGGGTPPPNTVSHSSLEWNLENTTWDVTQGSTDTKEWKSPTGNPGYPGFDTTNNWEWAMVYEMSMDVSVCGSDDIIVSVPSAHNSPPKDGTEDVPICPDGCPLQGLGDYVWWDEDGEDDQDKAADHGLDGVVVELYSGSCPPTGDPIATDTTSGGGYYYFGNLPAGQYCVKLADSNFESGGALYNYRALTDQNAAGVPDDQDSDFDPTNHTVSVTLAAGEENLTIDAGVEYTGPPTAITLSSFAVKSSADGSASRLWLGLAGLAVAAGSFFWAKRRVG